jgi:hypothetical protein
MTWLAWLQGSVSRSAVARPAVVTDVLRGIISVARMAGLAIAIHPSSVSREPLSMLSGVTFRSISISQLL